MVTKVPTEGMLPNNSEIQDKPDDMDKPSGKDEPVDEDESTHQNDLASPAYVFTPIRENPEDNPADIEPVTKTQDYVVVTGEHQGPALETSTTLAKMITKNELPSKEKGKVSLQFQSFEDLDVGSLHQGYLT